MSASVTVEGLGVRFLFDRQKRPVTNTLARLRRKGQERWGLRDLDLSVGAGEGVALLGASGSGKTSLLRAVAGILVPDEGRVEVRGRLASLLAIDAGLLSPLTGSENAELLGVLSGLDRSQARARLSEVDVESGLSEALDRPVGSFSQGMRARLAFAAADRGGPQVLLLDEVHEAFDHDFRAVLAERAASTLQQGGIVLATGHDHPMLETLCPRALLLEDGRLVRDGPFAEVRDHYRLTHGAGLNDG